MRKKLLALALLFSAIEFGFSQSIPKLIKSASDGDVHAQVTLGEMYLYGSGTGVNLDSAIHWFQQAAHDHYVAARELIHLGVRTGDEDDDRGVYLAWMNYDNVSSSPEYDVELQGNQYVYPNQDIQLTVNNGEPCRLTCDDSKYFSQKITLNEGVNVVRVFRDGKCVIERPVVYSKSYRSQGEVELPKTRDIDMSGSVASVRKAALVIGNSQYMVASLKNPANDAADMASKLKSLGFEVDLETNLTLSEFENAIRDFGDRTRDYDVALFFYAGHGVQVQGDNYLVPVDAVIGSEADVKYKCENANYILDILDENNVKLKIVILDACRNNPFARSLGRGLASMTSPSGTFLAFATSPGDVALDGKTRNSPYTQALLQHLSTPGISIYECFQNISETVSKSTRGHQNPWMSASLRSMFYFNK